LLLIAGRVCCREVRGDKRVGFFALRDIAEDEEICFDYKWQRIGKERMR
jgi:SET domain-containing protein